MKEKHVQTGSLRNGKTVWAAYWTSLTTNERLMQVRFRFPMNFGMLRAAEQAAGELAELADWLRDGGLANATELNGQRLQWLMPCHEGRRKLLRSEGLMDLTLGCRQFQIEMVTERQRKSADALAEAIEDTAEDICWWMKENAYLLQLQ